MVIFFCLLVLNIIRSVLPSFGELKFFVRICLLESFGLTENFMIFNSDPQVTLTPMIEVNSNCGL